MVNTSSPCTGQQPQGNAVPATPATPASPSGLTVAQALDFSGKIVKLFHSAVKKHHKIRGDKKTPGGPILEDKKKHAGAAILENKFNGEDHTDDMAKAVATAQQGEEGLETEEAIDLVTKVAHVLLGGSAE